MRGEILKELDRLEREKNIKIVYAVESGSRAWGFSSTDSDWDVRFIYLEEKLEHFTNYLSGYSFKNAPGYEQLNHVFRQTLKEAWNNQE